MSVKGVQQIMRPAAEWWCKTMSLNVKSSLGGFVLRLGESWHNRFKMAFRRAVDLLPRGRGYVCMFWRTKFERAPEVNSQTCGFNEYLKKQTLHTGSSMMVAKLLSVDELFARRSLQGYLKKMEIEYHQCLKAVDGGEECGSENELRAKRTRFSLLSPLINSIKELETKRRELTETETLLEGEVHRRFSWKGCFLNQMKIILILNCKNFYISAASVQHRTYINLSVSKP